MIFEVLTLFPELFDAFRNHSIISRALSNGLIDINPVNIRDFALNKHRQADDYPYGGGAGMVMTPQPLGDSIKNVLSRYDNKDGENQKPPLIYLSPQGKVLNQKMSKELSKYEVIILLCGHYEGIDQRIIDLYVDMEISIGDYVLTGGELPAMVLIDCISRHIPGVLGSGESVVEESHTEGLLEYPQYTRPREFEGLSVPDVLLSGHHKEIDIWRRSQALKNTLLKRPDLLRDAKLTEEDKKVLEMLKGIPKDPLK